MTTKTCIITGANAGIGKEAAVQVANQGYHVVLACRNAARGEAALKEVQTRITSGSVELMLVDMSLQSSIKTFARSFLTKYSTLDVLIHNAAKFDIAEKEPVFTSEGIESVWATNHVGPVLLTELLLGALEKSSQGRVLTVSSKGLLSFPFLKVDLKDPEFRERKFSVAKAYYQSKLAQVMYTYWLAERLSATRVTANCIRVTNVKIDLNRYPDIGRAAQTAYKLKSKFSITPEEMAHTYTYLATSAELDRVTGKHFGENNRPVSSSKYSRNSTQQQKVMELTMGYLENTL